MDYVNLLRTHGLFDAKVPRYTSYPPANRFVSGVGARFQKEWLATVSPRAHLSIYIHIPFCRRLCWFCACRTQGTQTLAPVESYIRTLLDEVALVATSLPPNVQMARLHLGGGTPTLLNASLMQRLLEAVYARFQPSADFEFSVEIDPTEAEPDVLKTLSSHKMTRASVGVQDFNADVQKAIGRIQSFELTRSIIYQLRELGVSGLNIDFLYGLPFQSDDSLKATLDQVVSLQPDRLALYGYAHVPHVSKRQVMIPDTALPEAERRFLMAQCAREKLTQVGYKPLGIDHFALPHDRLTKAAETGKMRRNFQGYTDDPCEILIGLGASAISKLPQGYYQNAVATSAYAQRIEAGGLAAHKGFELGEGDRFVAAMIDDMMCEGVFDTGRLARTFPNRHNEIEFAHRDLVGNFDQLFSETGPTLRLKKGCFAAARLIAAHLDGALAADQIHSLAV